MNGFEEFLKKIQSSIFPEQHAFGWYHLTFLSIALVACVLFFLFRSKLKTKAVKWILFAFGIYFILDEIALEVISSYNGIDPVTGDGFINENYKWAWRYAWNYVPWQLCSFSIYFYLPLSLLFNAKSKTGKLFRDSLASFCGTILFCAGGFVFLYPANIFGHTVTTFYAIRTMFCHFFIMMGGFILLTTRQFKFNVWSFLKTIVILAIIVALGVMANEVYYYAYYVPKCKELGVDRLDKYTNIYCFNMLEISAHFSFKFLDPLKEVFYYPQWYWVFVLLYYIVLSAACCATTYIAFGCDKLSNYIFIKTDVPCPKCKKRKLVIWRHVGGASIHCDGFPTCHYTLKDERYKQAILNEYLKPKQKVKYK